MTREQLEHIIRAAAAVADDREIIVFGGQAVLAQFPLAPDALLGSMKADVWPKNQPDRWELIDGSLGEGSPFHETFGYYAQGVEERTAVLPAGWHSRLVPIHNENTAGAIGWALEVHDLLVAKLVAGREKDMDFVRVSIAEKLASAATILERLAATDLTDERRSAVAARVGWAERRAPAG